jgi:hypothetical protein
LKPIIAAVIASAIVAGAIVALAAPSAALADKPATMDVKTNNPAGRDAQVMDKAFLPGDVASAASSNLWLTPYDAAAQAISGYPDTHADFEDDWTEWQTFLSDPSCPQCVLGFTQPFLAPTDLLYHRIFLSPQVTTAMLGAIPAPPTHSPIGTRLDNGTQDPMGAAISLMTFIHENYHLRFVSGDEGLVNACALRDFPYWLSTEFQIPATTTVTVPKTVTRTRRVVRYRWRRIHHHRRRVRYFKRIRHTVTVYVQHTQPNSLHQTLVADAHTFYASQPVPYSTGTCTKPAIG